MNYLEGLHRADAAIIGAELPGLLLGASLAHAGMKVLILKGNENSMEGPETATLLKAQTYARIEAVHGSDIARQYAASLQSHLHALISHPPPYVQAAPTYAYASSKLELPMLERQLALYQRMHLPVSIAPDAGDCPFPVELSLTAPGQAVVDISRWKAALQASIHRQGGRIFQASSPITVERSRICTPHGCTDAPHIIVTSGKPLGLHISRLLSLLESRLSVHCMMTGPYPLHCCHQPLQDGVAICPSPLGVSASYDAGRLGGRKQEKNIRKFEASLYSHLADWKPEEAHYAITIHPLDGLPVIGALPDSQLLCIAGVSEPLEAMHGADVLSRRLLGHTIPEDACYAPNRKLPDKFRRSLHLKQAFIRLQNTLRFRAPICRHCSCRIRYCSPARHWACPFCGTVYDMLGRVIYGPGIYPAEVSILQRPDV